MWIEASQHHFKKESNADCKQNNAYRKPFHNLNGLWIGEINSARSYPSHSFIEIFNIGRI